ncbi:MAG TPA: peptidase U35 [Chromatiales bacterium]|nr:peptidase U35 [Chromatiales bacterium]
MKLTTRLAHFTPSSVNGDARTATVVFSTGARVLRKPFLEEPFFEELSLDPTHVRLDRLNNGAPLLDSHKRGDLSGQIGVVESATVDGKQGTAVIRFSDREDVRPVFDDVQAGVVRNVSIGYVVHAWRDITGPDDKHPVKLAVDWEPYEISLVTVGADAAAGVRSADMETEDMGDETKQNTTETSPRERKRAAAIVAACRAAGLGIDYAEELLASDLSLDQARARILDELASLGDATPTYTQRATGDMLREGRNLQTFDNPEFRRDAMAEALACRHTAATPSEAAREFAYMSLVDMARLCLRDAGVDTRLMGPATVIERAIGGTTSDFPRLLTSTGNRMLRQAYDTAPAGLKRVARETTAPDFRAKTALQLGEMPELLKVSEHGEFTHGGAVEASESYAVATYGRIFGLSRQALVNDDLGTFAQMNTRLGRAAAEFEAKFLADLLLSNPTMGDGNALFSSTHGNLAANGAAMTVASLGVARASMRLQTGLDGKTPVNAEPRFLLVPATQETLAEQVITDIAATTVGDANPFSGRLEVVVEPRLDATSTTAWYLFADPNAIDTLEYAHLEEAQGPQLFIKEGWTVDGIEFKVRDDFGAGFLDWRGAYKDPGA